MKKGTALIWISMLSVVILTVTSGIVAYVLQESKMSVNSETSSLAYGAARSGINWGKYILAKPPGISGTRNHTMVIRRDGAGNPDVQAIIVLDATVTPNRVISRGEYLSGGRVIVARQLEYELPESDLQKITPPRNFTDPNNRYFYYDGVAPDCSTEGVCNPVECTNTTCAGVQPALADKNFTLQFDFWYRNIKISNPGWPGTTPWPSQIPANNAILFGLTTNQVGAGPSINYWALSTSGLGLAFEPDGTVDLFYKTSGSSTREPVYKAGSNTVRLNLSSDFADYQNTADNISAYRAYVKVINGSFLSAKLCRVVYDGAKRTDEFLCIGHAELKPSGSADFLPTFTTTFNRVLARFERMVSPAPADTKIVFDNAMDTIVFTYNQPATAADLYYPGSYGFYFNNVYLTGVVKAPSTSSS